MPEMTNILERRAPGCAIGILIVGNVCGSPETKALDDAKHSLEKTIRNACGGMARKELAAIHPIDAYVSYYKKFGYSYHVLGQLESILGGKSLPGGNPLVGAMFAAELKNMLLTAGHDLDGVSLPISLSTAAGTEEYALLNGRVSAAVAGDYVLSDGEGPLSSILRGPAGRACITARTKNVLYTVYAPRSIEEELVCRHLDDIETYVRMYCADSATLAKKVYPG
jgi:DNA/RNA-binding domain of Phe-tRNA-synthetase-like protein